MSSMYATELMLVFRGLLEDYNLGQAIQLLDQASVLLAQRGRLNNEAYSAQAQNLRQRAAILLKSNSVNDLPLSTKSLLRESEFAPVLPDRVAEILLHSVQLDPGRGASSSEMEYFAGLLREKIARLSVFTDVVANLNLPIYEPEIDQVAFRIVLADRSYHADLEEMSKRFIDFDRFVNLAREVLAPRGDKPELLYLSNGSAIAVLVGTVAVVQAVFAMYGAAIEAATNTVNLLKALGVVKAGADAPGFTQDQVDQFGQKFVEQALEKQFASLGADFARDVEPGTRTRLVMTTSLVVEHVQGGSRISLDNVTDRQVAEIETIIGDNGPSVPALIEKSRTLEELADALAAAVEPLKQIAGPPDEEPPAAIREI